MTKPAQRIPDYVVPAEFSELCALVWNRNPKRRLPAAEAFALYERNWRHVEPSHMAPKEAKLVRDLTAKYGHGVMLG